MPNRGGRGKQFTVQEQLDHYGFAVDENDCWNWLGPINGYGYGWFSALGERKLVHRVMLGDIPKDKLACHTCDNRKCGNPSHLYAGTHKENTADMVKRGRQSKLHGEKGANSKLSALQVEEIRDRLSAGAKQVTLAREFGVNDSTISRIKTRKRWHD